MDEFENLFGDNSVEDEIVETEDEVTETVETVEEEETAEETETVEETVEDEESETSETVEETVAETVEEPSKEAPQSVPVSVMIAERNRAKQAEQELALLRQQMAQAQAAQTQPIDPYDDPEGYRAQLQEQMRAQIQEEMRVARANESISRSVEKYGQEAINELADWAESMTAIDPSFANRAFAQADAVEWTIAERKRIEQRQLFETDPDAFVRQRAQELGLTAIQTVAAQNTTITETGKPSTGPKSLVHAQSRNAPTKQSGKDDFTALFDK
jgi:hypothetical protein